MNNSIPIIIHFISGTILLLFFLGFAISSLREEKPRATNLSLFFIVIISSVWYWYYQYFAEYDYLILLPTIFIALVGILFFLPIGEKKVQRIIELNEKVDERDTVFSRMGLKKDSKDYNDYYKKHPDAKPVDDKIRKLPRLCAPGGKYFDPIKSVYVKSIFKYEEMQTSFVDGKLSTPKVELSAREFTSIIKNYAFDLGVKDIGITELNPHYIYSHVGIGPEEYSSEINNNHKFAIAFTLEMDYKKVSKAPLTDSMEQTALQYITAQRISISLAQFIRGLGHPARAHISGSNYQIMLPPIAWEAGLGEMSRMGYLVTPNQGGRVRLGAVTTDLPLLTDSPIEFGVQDFCEKCKKCADHCPSGSIPSGGKEIIRGVEKWLVNTNSCYKYWRFIGTDCAICMKVCPFSHPNTFFHKLLRSGIKRSSLARWISLKGENLFYG